MMRLTTFIGLLIGLIAGGCDVLTGDDGNLPVTVRTDETAYAPLSSTTIRLTVTNRSADPIFYQCTGQIFLEEWADGERTNRWMVHGFEECLAARPIAPDSSARFGLPFAEDQPLAQLDDARFTPQVRYRLIVDLYADDRFQTLLHAERRTSNWFGISSPRHTANTSLIKTH